MKRLRLKHWAHDRDDIYRRIAAGSGKTKAPLKILLKTKDEPEMLGRWIEHHRRIVGLENLIVLDNMSRDASVRDIYDRYHGDLTIFQYDVHYNLVHHPKEFSHLYDALRKSCHYFTFLDTDEQLVLFDGRDRFYRDESINDFLVERMDTPVFPGTEFQNEIGHSDKFRIDDPVVTLQNGLKWGKPIIAADRELDGMINHNTQLRADLYPPKLTTNFFVLHLCRLFPLQRIKANLKKLIGNQVIREDQGVEDLLSMDFTKLPFPDGKKTYATEIRDLTMNPDDPAIPPLDHFEITDTGLLKCDADWKYHVLQEYIRNPMPYSAELFASPSVRSFAPAGNEGWPARDCDGRVTFMLDDVCLIGGSELHLNGWVVPADEIDRVRIRHNGAIVGDAALNDHRPDVREAFPEHTGANPGFAIRWKHDAVSFGTHVFEAQLLSSDGRIIASFAREFVFHG